MINKKILVTGAAGFIGFHLINSLLKDGYKIFGVDNINDYYNTELKKNRLKNIINHSNFIYEKVDITNREKLKQVFLKFKPNKVINLAAQAGVRYSIDNPHAYMNSNLVGFLNVLELCRHSKTEGLIYASSSSVYGNSQNVPFNENEIVNKPISLYAATKISNELLAHSYSHLYNLNTTGLRFFTVYGPWGRPDMAYYIFTKKILDNEVIDVYNKGKMFRDFTYIDDIVHGIKAAISKNYNCEIFNLGNNKTENLLDFIKIIEEELNVKSKINLMPLQSGDMVETFADIEKAKKMLLFKPTTSIELGVKKFISWYKKYYNL